MEENLDAPEVLETPEGNAETTETQEEEKVELTKSELDALKEKADQVDDLTKKNKQLFERAKKNPQVEGISDKDLLFLAKTDIHEDDLDELKDWAKFKKVPLQEAYKQIKGTLDIRNEERKTAAATATKPGARGTTKVSDDDVYAKAQQGEVIDSVEGMQSIFKARQQARLGKKR